MRALWMFIKFFLLLIIGAVGAMLALENGQQLAVNFVLFQGPSLSLGLWLIVFLAAGCLLGLMAGSVLIMFYRRKLAHAAKKKD